MADLSLVFDLVARDNASREFDKVGDAADRAGTKGKAFGTALAAGAVIAVGAAVKFGRDSVAAYTEAEHSSLRLDQALAKFPATADRSRESFDRLNTALAQKTRFDDDATASGQAVLAQFQLTGAQIIQLTPLLQDYAAKTGKDLPTAALDLGKAVQGQGRALKAVGLDLKDTGTATGNLEQLTAGLRTQVGGFATAEGATAAGQAAILGNRFGEVQEAVGARLVPALTALAGVLISTIDFTERNSEVVLPLAAAIGALTVGVLAVNAATAAGTAITAAATTVRAFFTTTTIAATGAERASTISRIAGTVATVAQTAALGVLRVATVAFTAVQTALNFVLAANPIGLVIIALVALVAAVVIAYKNSETFRNIVQAAFAAVKVAVEALRQAFATAMAAIVSVFNGGGGQIGSIIRAVVGVVRDQFAAFMQIARGAINVVVGLFTGDFGRVLTGAKQVLGGLVSYFTTIPRLLLGALGDLGGLLVNAGRQLMEGLARGIGEKIEAVVGRVRDAVAQIGRLLPGSPIKEGPLLGWNNGGAGLRLMQMLASGINTGAPLVRSSVVGALDGSLNGVGGSLDMTGVGDSGVGSKLDEIKAAILDDARRRQVTDRQMVGV